jgi:hypothetical protein
MIKSKIRRNEEPDHEFNADSQEQMGSNPFFMSAAPPSEVDFHSGGGGETPTSESFQGKCQLCNIFAGDLRLWSCGHSHHNECAELIGPFFAVGATLCPMCQQSSPFSSPTDMFHEKAARRYFALERKVHIHTRLPSKKHTDVC